MTDDERKERIARLETIAVQIDALMQDIGPKWIRVGHLNREAKAIVEDLESDPES